MITPRNQANVRPTRRLPDVYSAESLRSVLGRPKKARSLVNLEQFEFLQGATPEEEPLQEDVSGRI